MSIKYYIINNALSLIEEHSSSCNCCARIIISRIKTLSGPKEIQANQLILFK